MITFLLVQSCKLFKPKDINEYFNRIFLAFCVIGNIVDILGAVGIAYLHGMLITTSLAIAFSILIRWERGLHYPTFFKCFITGCLTYSIYSIVSKVCGNVWVDVVFGVLLGVYMIEPKKLMDILKRG